MKVGRGSRLGSIGRLRGVRSFSIVPDNKTADELHEQADVFGIASSRLGIVIDSAVQARRSHRALFYYAEERVAKLVQFDEEGNCTTIANYPAVWGVVER